jgi:ketosteroid isomerase-like protein
MPDGDLNFAPARLPVPDQDAALHTLRDLEAQRLAAMRSNDAAALEALLAPSMVYIHESGRLYHREDYLRAISSRALTYHEDIELSEEEVMTSGAGLYGFGVMHGHGLLDGEQQVFHLRYLAAWVPIDGAWRLAIVQKTPIFAGMVVRQEAV